MALSKQQIQIYTNESVDVAVAEGLKRRGVNAWSARDGDNLGLTDEEQLEYGIKKKAVIFTHDDDFLSLVTQSELKHNGVIYVHQQSLSVGECIRRLKTLVETKTNKEVKNYVYFL